MSSRRKVLFIPALALASALAWGAVGGLTAASGQTPSGFIARAHSGDFAPDFTKPLFLLLLGGDARRGTPLNMRTDSIHILAIVPPATPGGAIKASIIGIPRDSYVDIPGHGKTKINNANAFGGPALMTRTVEQLSGCRFDYYMLTAFDGFRGKVRKIGGRFQKIADGLIDAMGGIDFVVPRGGLHDSYAHADLSAGKHHFYGSEALQWSRSRHARPRGDFDRQVAQGQLMIAALREARKDYKADPGTALRDLAALRKFVRMDIPVLEALKLGLFAMKIKPGNVHNAVVDGGTETISGAGSIVRISQTGLNQLQAVCSGSF